MAAKNKKDEIKYDLIDVEKNERDDDETAQEYNERVPATYQPLADPITTNYLGEPRE